MSEIVRLNDTTFKATLGDLEKARAQIVLGSMDFEKILPNINAQKWSDECFINLNPKWFSISSSTLPSFENGIVSLQNNHIKWLSYVDAKGRLENGLAFAVEPAGNEVRFELLFSDSLRFCWQGPLSQEEIENWEKCNREGDLYPKYSGAYRPDDVVGSYAVYHNRANGKYATGKFCHIYAPYFVDAKGSRIKLEQRIEGNELIISWEQAIQWLKTAKYPITLDPNLGFDQIGESSKFVSYGTNVACHDTTDASGGDTSNIYWHQAYTAGSAANMSVYSDDTGNNRPETRLADLTGLFGGEGPSWFSRSFIISLDPSTKYWVASHPNNSDCRCSFDDDEANREHHYDNNEDPPATWPDSGTNSDDRWSIYVDYEAAVGAEFELLIGAGGMDGGFLGGNLNPMTG